MLKQILVKEHNEVIGHARAIDLIYDFLEEETLNEEKLFLLHKAIQTQVVIDSEKPNGAYKRVLNGSWHNINNKSEFFAYPHPDEVKHLMGLWFEKFGNINKEIKSEEEAITIYTTMHLSFTLIHPFWDGNGRLARLVSNLPLLKNDYLPMIVSIENRKEYIDLLSSYQQTTKALNAKTTLENLIEYENESYLKLLDFFRKESKNSEELLVALDEGKGKY